MRSISDPNELFNEDIFERYTRQPNLPQSTLNKVFDFDSLTDDHEICLVKVPADFETSLLSGKSISISEQPEPTSRQLDDLWEISSQPISSSISNMTSFDVLLPVQALEGAVAMAPKKPTIVLSVSRKVALSNFIQKSKELRDEPYVPPPQPQDLKQRFFPYGYFTAEDTDVSKESNQPTVLKETGGSKDSKKSTNGSKKKKRKETGTEEAASTELKKKKKKTTKAKKESS